MVSPYLRGQLTWRHSTNSWICFGNLISHTVSAMPSIGNSIRFHASNGLVPASAFPPSMGPNSIPSPSHMLESLLVFCFAVGKSMQVDIFPSPKRQPASLPAKRVVARPSPPNSSEQIRTKETRRQEVIYKEAGRLALGPINCAMVVVECNILRMSGRTTDPVETGEPSSINPVSGRCGEELLNGGKLRAF